MINPYKDSPRPEPEEMERRAELLRIAFAEDYERSARGEKIRPRLGDVMSIQYMRERQTLSFVLHPELKEIAYEIGYGIGKDRALIAAWLKNALGINEVILTIMLNYVAQYVVSYLVSFPFHAEGNVVRTEDIQPTASMKTMVPHTRLYTGIYLAVAATALIWLMLRYTKFGYELRAVGSNSSAAETAGINAKKYILAAMFLSGALAGIGGAGEVLGYWGYYIPTMTQGYGFDGIAIATMGRSQPLGTFISAFLFGALRNGATGMNRSTSIPGELIEVLDEADRDMVS